MVNHNILYEIDEYCDKRGDKYHHKLIELMDICNAINLQEVSDEDALAFLNGLKGGDSN